MNRKVNFFCIKLGIPAILLLYGCGSDSEPSPDCNASNLQASASNVQDAACGLDNGSFDLTVSGGNAPYELTISGFGSQTVQMGVNTIDGLPSGNYTLNLRDGSNCNVSTNVNISNDDDLIIETQIQDSGCETTDGVITVTATGGSDPYMYSLDGGPMQAENMFSGLGVGDYTALVTDAGGCQTSITVSVFSGVSYNDNIAPIISTNCAISNCHDGSNGAAPDWTNLETVQANAENIKTRTSDQSMPPAGRPDLQPEEIEAIACWVDDGALEN
jgi:hypothetical protein